MHFTDVRGLLSCNQLFCISFSKKQKLLVMCQESNGKFTVFTETIKVTRLFLVLHLLHASTRAMSELLARLRIKERLQTFLLPRQPSLAAPAPLSAIPAHVTLYAYASVAVVVAFLQWYIAHVYTDLTIDHYAEGLKVLETLTDSELATHKLFYRLYAAMLVCILAAFSVSLTLGIQYAVCRFYYKSSDVDVGLFAWMSLFFSLLQTGVVVSLVIEMHLLSDMSVHFIDFDLASYSLMQTVKRRHSLGANLKPALKSAIRIGVTTAIVSIFVLTLAAARFHASNKQSHAHIKKALAGVAGYVVVMLYLTNHPEHVISIGSPMFQDQVPFNMFHVRSQPVQGINKVSTAYPPTGGAYPVLEEGGPYPKLTNKRNIFYIAHESLRTCELTPEYAPYTSAFLEKYGSITSEYHSSSGHVSELSHFTLFYGLHAYLLNQFHAALVPSFFFDVLRYNGYVSMCLFSTRVWSFPNDNLFNNCDEIYIEDHWTDFTESHYKRFIDARVADGVPFLVYMSPYRTEEHEETLVDYGVQQDKLRQLMFEYYEQKSLMANSIVVLTGDHGDMNGEHKEQGHGQPESNWWNEKMLVPLHIILPTGEAGHYHKKLGLTSHVDIVPTLIEYLKPEEPIPIHYYSNGMNLLIPKTAKDTTQERYAVQTSRYFPSQEKTNAFANLMGGKFWFRVKSTSSTGHFNVVPIWEGDWQDESTCPKEELNKMFPAALERAWKRATPASGVWDTQDFNYQAHPDIIKLSAASNGCNIDYWAAVLVDYNIKFNTFYLTNPPLS